jgi:hypothetical protein
MRQCNTFSLHAVDERSNVDRTPMDLTDPTDETVPADSRPKSLRPSHRTMASQGDIRVLFVIDLVLSAVFSAVVIWGLSVLDVLAFAWRTVALVALAIAVLTYLVVLR